MFSNIDWHEVLTLVLIIAITLVITAILLKIATRLMKKEEELHGARIHVKFLYNVLRLFIILLALATIGSQFRGFKSAVTTILASSGIIALGLSLAAQESMTNIIDGIFLSIFKPFNIGDRVTLPENNGLTGTVSEINLRHTVITTYNQSSYIIPNAVMSSAIIDNSNFHNATYSYPIDVSVSYDSDLELAMELLKQAVITHPDFVDARSDEDRAAGKPVVTVLCRNFGSSGIDLRCPMVTRDVAASFKACSDVRLAVKKLYDENGINIPFDTIHIDNWPNQ